MKTRKWGLLACCALMAWPGPAARAEPTSSTLEGTLDFMRPGPGAGLEVELVSGTNHTLVMVENAGGNSPTMFSRIQAPARKVSGWDQIKILTGFMVPIARNVADLRRMGAAGQHAGCVADLSGQILAVSPNGKFLAFADGTGVMLLEMSPPGKAVAAGENVHVEGNCVVEGVRGIFRSPPVVDNNDIHAMKEGSGVIYLTAGRHALRLDWFNHEYPYGLEVYYEGPALPRQLIPNSALYRQETDPATGRRQWVNGLKYRCYEGSWLRIPAFEALLPAKEGIVTNFYAGVVTRINDVGLEFTGYVEAPREGMYTFSTISDDGSLVFVDERPPVIEVIRTDPLPKPAPIALGQSLQEGQEVGWSQAEGRVRFASDQSGQVELELSSDMGRMRVEVADSSGVPWQLLLHSRIRATGICLSTRTTDGQTVAGVLLAPGMNQIEFWEPETERWIEHPVVPVDDAAA
ncbi:MAG TPA: PA14 domain-containing protein, partial [Verrucomicrobiae bacterium]|nr:PA14 domain-containing protein [Verrucomicrobiae bacterium]